MYWTHSGKQTSIALAFKRSLCLTSITHDRIKQQTKQTKEQKPTVRRVTSTHEKVPDWFIKIDAFR